ncbi:hypothetical protein CXG81DRAFT_8504, partial [Caulochytrium protostelioides]
MDRERRILSRLPKHPNIASLQDRFEDDDYIYLVLEYCPSDLYDAITRYRHFPDDVVREVSMKIVDALLHCHDNGVFHRDLKPENILLTEDFGVKLSDFGLSTDEAYPTADAGCGTTRYLSPACLE